MSAQTGLRIALLLSGAGSLMLQTIWVRRLGFVFGNTVLSTSVVLSSFFFGMAIGSRWIGRHADRVTRPIRFYVKLELGILVAAALVWVALDGLEPLYVWLYRNVLGHDIVAISTLKFAATFTLLAAPTFLMGGTLPVVVRCLSRGASEIAPPLGSAYAINTFGACLGLFAAGFVLIETFGLRGAYLLACLTGAAAAAVAWIAAKTEQEIAAPPPQESYERGDTRFLAIAFASGAIAIGYEVLWIRLWSMISLHSTSTQIGRAPAEFSSTYVFSGIVLLFLIGIAGGSAIVPRLRRSASSCVRQLAVVQILLGIWGTFGILLERSLFLDSLGAKLLEIAVIVLPTTTLMGVGLPLAAGAYMRSSGLRASELGLFYALNAFGSALGPILFGLVILPWKGTYATLSLLAFANLAIGLWLLTAAAREDEPSIAPSRSARRAWAPAVAVAGIACVLALPFPSALMRPTDPGTRLLLEEDNEVAHTLLLEDSAGWKALVVNNQLVSAVDQNHDFGNIGIQVPASLMGRVPDNILILCVGTGGSWAASLRYPNARITAVDINPSVFRSLPLIHQSEIVRGMNRPGMRPVVADARNFLLLEDQTYDIINIDPAPPITQPGMVNLHTIEFYELARRRLRPGGILVQRFGVGDEADFWYPELLRAIADVFNEVTVWKFLREGGIDVIASDRRFDTLHADPALIDPRVFAGAPHAFLFGREEVDAITRDAAPLADDRPTLEFNLLARLFDQDLARGARFGERDLASRVRPMSDSISMQSPAGGG